MIFTMPKYECRYYGKQRWEDVSEKDLLRDISEFYGTVTPVIRQMIKGKQVRTAIALYRLKLSK
jgi:hypothetical protein